MNLDALQPIMIAITQERSSPRVMQSNVDGLTEGVGFALTRIWVRGPGDRCGTCLFALDCANKSECLHLVASEGGSIARNQQWSGIEGRFSRFPLGHRKIGHIGATGKSILIQDVQQGGQWLLNHDWAAAEGIRNFAGHPLIFRREVLGVLGIFCRDGIAQDAFRWLRFFADQAAIALANARAFEQIERLTRELRDENILLREEVLGVSEHRDIVGNSIALRRLLDQIELVAPTDAAIPIQGESGSGKELLARAVHQRSRRADKPLLKVNCAAVPRELFESEFFGHVKGALTGAVRDRVGRFQLADRGTLFLDEIGEILLELQSKLLRVLQEGEFERTGETTTRKVNVRIIAATNQNLKDEVLAGRFREDLFYRLSIFPITAPPLRDRPGDVPALIAHFVRVACQRMGVAPPAVSKAQMEMLQSYS